MKKLKIKSNGMLSPIAAGNASSWIYTIHSIMTCFEKMGHDLFLQTTNGVREVDKKWFKYFRDCSEPDLEVCYTLPQNILHRSSGTLSGTKRAALRCLIFNYESSILPQGWADYSKYCDYWLPSSDYCADIFRKAGVPDEKIVVLPLGVNFDALSAPLDDFSFKTKKRFKLLNISIPHPRKNIPQLIDSYFQEFSANDDICLIIKTSLNNPKNKMEIDVLAALEQIRQAHIGKKLPEIEIIDHRFNNIATAYKQCNALINVAASEGFGLPLLEMMACGGLVAAPRYGGVLDFLDRDNSLLIDTQERYCGAEYQYWQASQYARVGFPIKESIMATMRNLYENQEDLHKRFDKNMAQTVAKYTWENSAKIILDLYTGIVPKKEVGELI